MSWLGRLKAGLKRSSDRLTDGIQSIFSGRRRLDAATAEELEELLIQADLGVATAGRLVEALRRRRLDGETDDREVRRTLAAEIRAILEPHARPLRPVDGHRPHVVLVAGVNGSGKTTTIGKLAHRMTASGLKVWVAAGDTFRAAAGEQLEVWGRRTGAVVVRGPDGGDAAALAFDALAGATRASADMLLIDTAGRLQNKTGLMDELAKIVRVLRKHDPAVPHDTLLVLDATVGQNAFSQVELFRQAAPLSGLVVTKLDGSAKGGVLVGLVERFGLPVMAIGVGEGADDLRDFDPAEFADALLGLDEG
jgi:fused signal recognition particle receptor